MTILKKGTCSASVTTSSRVYVCSGCGYTEMATESSIETKECSKCHGQMTIISGGTSEESLSDKSSDIV